MREHQIYISAKLRKRLFYLRELEKDQKVYMKDYASGAIEIMPPRILTIDEIAGRLLNEKIEQDFPQMPILEKRMDALEGQLIVELLNPPPEKETNEKSNNNSGN